MGIYVGAIENAVLAVLAKSSDSSALQLLLDGMPDSCISIAT
jgi:hypothetical protein